METCRNCFKEIKPRAYNCEYCGDNTYFYHKEYINGEKIYLPDPHGYQVEKNYPKKNIAYFFVCPNSDCQAKQSTTKLMDRNIGYISMNCKKCFQRGKFIKNKFYYRKCEVCHHTRYYQEFGKKKKWIDARKQFNLNDPCPHCNTYGSGSYRAELSGSEKGIQVRVDWKREFAVFLMMIIVIALLLL